MPDARRALARGHIGLIAVFACALCAYGYGAGQDPFVAAWKDVAADANQGRWTDAASASHELDAGLAELETGLGWKLREPIAKDLAARDARELARDLTRAACGMLIWKLESSRRAGLGDYYAAKYRLEAARGVYQELVAPALRARDPRAHERVLAALDAAQTALGRPGFLGRGVVAPDAAAFAAAQRELGGALRAVFPFVPEVPP